MKKSRLLFLMSALAVMAAMVLVACGSDDDSDSGSSSGGDVSSELITAGTLTVGSDIPFPPFEFGKAPDYDGFDIDLTNRQGGGSSSGPAQDQGRQSGGSADAVSRFRAGEASVEEPSVPQVVRRGGETQLNVLV